MMKQRLKGITEQFNAKPLKSEWVQLAHQAGILELAEVSSTDSVTLFESFDPKSIAEFLKNTPGLGKQQIGEFIGKGPAHLYPFHAQVLKEFMRTFHFEGSNTAFDKALRLVLGSFRLPGEAQCIDRIMEAFAGRYFEILGPNKPFASADAVFILSFSTIMLNTDLHNPQIAANKKMSKEDFIKNNRGINDGQNLPKEYLESIFDEIKGNQIQVDVDISDNKSNTLVDFTDPTTWNKIILKGDLELQNSNLGGEQSLAAFTPTSAARKKRKKFINHLQFMRVDPSFKGSNPNSEIWQSVSCETDMFMVMSKRLFEVIVILWENVTDDYFLSKLMQCTVEYLYVCYNLKLKTVFDK
jgi:Sec7-like guanine-nucleotide exchange factor